MLFHGCRIFIPDAIIIFYIKDNILIEEPTCDASGTWSYMCLYQPGSNNDMWFPLDSSPKQIGRLGLSRPSLPRHNLSRSGSSCHACRHDMKSCAISMFRLFSGIITNFSVFLIGVPSRLPAYDLRPGPGLPRGSRSKPACSALT